MVMKTETEIMENWKIQKNPIVTILCATYNHENYIEEAIDSFLIQETNFPFEIIIHDDASADNTVNKIKTYAEKYPNIIKIILQKENQYSKGIWFEKVFLFMLENAKGKYYAVCEGDDYWIESKKLQIQIDLMEKNPECHMSFHAAEIRLNHDKFGKIFAKQSNMNKVFSTSEVILGGGGFCPTASIILRKEALSNLPSFFNFTPVGDYFVQIFGSLNGGALYIDKVMSVYRQGVAMSWSSSMMDIGRRVEFYQKYIKMLDELDAYFNHSYQDELAHEKSKQFHEMAVFYLYNDMYNEFKKYIELSYKIYPLKSSYYFIDYYLRSFPRLIKNLKILKHKLKV